MQHLFALLKLPACDDRAHGRVAVQPRGQGITTRQEMNDTSTWVWTGEGWQCPVQAPGSTTTRDNGAP